MEDWDAIRGRGASGLLGAAEASVPGEESREASRAASRMDSRLSESTAEPLWRKQETMQVPCKLKLTYVIEIYRNLSKSIRLPHRPG